MATSTFFKLCIRAPRIKIESDFVFTGFAIQSLSLVNRESAKVLFLSLGSVEGETFVLDITNALFKR
jgi:hypothetical protein